jgi:transcriptional regulator with XRE-family HTH domain
VAVAEQFPITFAQLLKQLRMDAGMTQEELAAAARLSARSVSDLERGLTLTARKETARLLAEALSLAGAERAEFELVAQGRATANRSMAWRAAVRAAVSFPVDTASFGPCLGVMSVAGDGRSRRCRGTCTAFPLRRRDPGAASHVLQSPVK